MPVYQGSQSILIIDDEANLRATLALILQRAGFTVTTAANVGEARQYLQIGPFDLIFLDLKMPEEDGITLLPEIRSRSPDTPVFILTAHATLDSAIAAIRSGARDYLLKPIDPAQIIQRVQDVLGEDQQPKRRRQIIGEIRGLLDEWNRMEGEENPALSPAPTSSINTSSRYLQRGSFSLDLHARHAEMNSKTISLSPTAFDYLVTLLRHSPNPVSYETLVLESQGYQASLIEARDLARWRIHELRKAMEDDIRQPKYIITVRGIGYRLVA